MAVIVKQRGFAFLPFLLANWQLIAIGLLVLTVYTYYSHCEGIKADRDRFIANLEAQAKAQEERVKQVIEQNRKDKEKADNENRNLRASNAALVRSLRDARSRSNYLPPAAPGAKRPEIATFDRSELERAIQRLDERVSGIVEKGDQARIDLDTAKEWAK